MNPFSQIDEDIALYRRLIQQPEYLETEDVLELVVVIKTVHAELHDLPPDAIEKYERIVDELDERLREIARAHRHIFEVYSRDWSTRVNILEDELGWEL